MSERNMPPSPGRLALARRAGLFVRSPLVGAGCVLVAMLAGAIMLAAGFWVAAGLGRREKR